MRTTRVAALALVWAALFAVGCGSKEEEIEVTDEQKRQAQEFIEQMTPEQREAYEQQRKAFEEQGALSERYERQVQAPDSE